jgi:phage terminase large subunit-like protein
VAVLSMTERQIEQWCRTLDADGLAVVELALSRHAALGWRADPAALAAHLTAGKFRQWRYIRLLSEKFRQLVTGESKRQIWNLPARMGKSELGSRWGPVWAFDQYPEANIILTSYGDALAMENALAVRDLLRGHGSELRTQLRKDRQKADRFKTDHGGGLLAAGIDASIIGFGAGNHGGVVVDDPFKNWQEAASKARREHVWNQYRSVLRSRLDDETAWILVLHTRWHEEDLTGKLIAPQLARYENVVDVHSRARDEYTAALKEAMEDEEQTEWDLTRLPALAEVHDPTSHDPFARMPDPLGRTPGEPLEPEKFTVSEVRRRAIDFGSFLASALEQQRPSPEEGDELLREWWKWFDTRPDRFDDAASSWDMKLKDNEKGDFVVGQAWGRTGADYWMLGQLRGQWNMATTKLAIALMAVRYPVLKKHFIENSGNGPDLKAQLSKPDDSYEVSTSEAGKLGMTADERAAVQRLIRRGMNRLILITPIGSKAVRARAIAPIAEAGHVHLPNHYPEALRFVDEASEFPNGTNDDQVDAWSQAISQMEKNGPARATAARSTRPEVKPGQAPVVPTRRGPPQGPSPRARTSASISLPRRRIR